MRHSAVCASLVTLLSVPAFAQTPTPAGGPASRLAALDRPALVAVALDELTGKNNGPRVLPGKTTPSIVVGLTALDEEFLARQVFLPYLTSPDKRSQLEQAACSRYLRRAAIEWNKTVGEALEAKVCDIHLEPRDLFVNPAVKQAIADSLLLGNPKRNSLLNEVRLSISDTAGAVPHEICYGADANDAPALDDPKCRLNWADAKPGEALRLAAFYFEQRPLEQWSAEDITDAWAALTGMRTKEARDRAGKLGVAFGTRIDHRDDTLAEHRAKAPALVPAADVANGLDKKAVFLWHSACSEPRRTSIETDAGATEADSICIKLAYYRPNKGSCFEDSFNYVKLPGTTSYVRFEVAGPTAQIECP